MLLSLLVFSTGGLHSRGALLILPPGLLLSVLLAQLPLAQLTPPGMLLSFLLAQLTVRLRQPN